MPAISSHILFPHIHPQDIIEETILEEEYIDPGYSGHAADVWRVRTAQRTVALRVFRAGESGGPFWSGLRWLFRWQPVVRQKVAARNRFLEKAGGLRTPQVLAEGQSQGLSYLVMEWIPGQHMESFHELSPAGQRAFGRHLAALHTHTFPNSGTLDGAKECAPACFPGELLAALGMLVVNFYRDRPEFANIHDDMLRRARQLRVESFAPVMVDLGASQYLRSEQGDLCALVDTDAYVIGPRELDFIILEYGLPLELAKFFIQGYRELLPLPRLREVRPLYRYLYRLMEVEGDVPLKEWMAWPELFD